MFLKGTSVFAKIAGDDVPWPAFIVSAEEAAFEKVPLPNTRFIFSIYDNCIMQVKNEDMQDFVFSFKEVCKKYYKKKEDNWDSAVFIMIKHVGYPFTKDLTREELYEFAVSQFSIARKAKPRELPDYVIATISNRKMRIFEKFDTPKNTNAFVAAVAADAHLTQICICCYAQGRLRNHLLFEAKCCDKCHTKIRRTFNVIYDGDYVFCTLCSNPGDLLICVNGDCRRGYCAFCATNMDWLLKDDGCIMCNPIANPPGLDLRMDYDISFLESVLEDDLKYTTLKDLPSQIDIISLTIGTSPVLMDLCVKSNDFDSVDNLDEDSSLQQLKGSNVYAHLIRSVPQKAEPTIHAVEKTLLKNSLTNLKNIGMDNVDWIIGGLSLTPKDVYDNDQIAVVDLFLEFHEVLRTLEFVSGRKLLYFFSLNLHVSKDDIDTVTRFMEYSPLILTKEDSPINQCLLWSNFYTS